MKLSKLMLTASIAAAALLACNKENTTPEPSKTLKSIEINIENLLMTKADAEGAIAAGSAVQLNDLKIYLVDANGNFYTGKKSDGVAAAQDYFAATAENTGDETVATATTKTLSFHYVDRAVTHVIAVGNLGTQTFANEAALNAYILEVDAQQHQGDLKLYDKEVLVGPDGTHDTDTWPNDQNVPETQKNQVYKAALTLMPRIARFEVDGFRVKFTSDDPATPETETPEYDNITISQLAFTNFNTQTPLYNLAPAGNVVNAVADYTNETAVYKWFNDHLTNDLAAPTWSYYVDATPLSFDAPAAGGELANDFTVKQAFHFFPGTTMPMFLVHLTADGIPAYLYTKNIKLDGTAMAAADFEPGHVYRMSAAGETANDGAIIIDEEDIDPMDRCVDITVSVHEWVVNLVTPEF